MNEAKQEHPNSAVDWDLVKELRIELVEATDAMSKAIAESKRAHQAKCRAEDHLHDTEGKLSEALWPNGEPVVKQPPPVLGD